MNAVAAEASAGPQARRDRLVHLLEHLGHHLPAQAPIEMFVHHNTLHFLEDRPFHDAISAATAMFGCRGYLPEESFRKHLQSGRIEVEDLEWSLDRHRGPDRPVGPFSARELDRLAMTVDLDPLEPASLDWRLFEAGASKTLMSGLPEASRARFLERSKAWLLAELDRVGVDSTFADFIDRVLRRTILGPALDRVRHVVHENPGARVSGDADEQALLTALGVTKDRWPTLRGVIDARLGPWAAHPGARVAWLEAERALAGRVLEDAFGIGPSVEALRRAIERDPEPFAVRAAWRHALVGVCGDVPVGVEAARQIAARWRHEIVDGGTIELSPAQQRALDELGVLCDHGHAEQGEPLDDIERLWIGVQSHIAHHHLSRAGFQALRALLSRPDAPPAPPHLLEALQTADPLERLLEACAAGLRPVVEGAGERLCHRDLLKVLTGIDLNERVNPVMIRVCSAFLDEGFAGWRMPFRNAGFYAAWRSLAARDATLTLQGVPGFERVLQALPVLAEDAVIDHLEGLGVPEEAWGGYLERVALQLPGWAGMCHWRGTHPEHADQAVPPASLVEFLAIRLTLERTLVKHLCRTQFNVDGTLADLVRYIQNRPVECMVRQSLYGNAVPDWLTDSARDALDHPTEHRREIHLVADALWRLREDRDKLESPHNGSWRLFQLCQLLGRSADEIAATPPEQLREVLQHLHTFDLSARLPVWQEAYERTFQVRVVNGVAANLADPPAVPQGRPTFQIVVCIDEREEAFRRHLEEADPRCQTFGHAGFFGLPIRFQGLDDAQRWPLCPIVVTPVHEITEVAVPEAVIDLQAHIEAREAAKARQALVLEARRSPLASLARSQVEGLLGLIPWMGRVLFPGLGHRPEAPSKVTTRLLPEFAVAGAPPGVIRDGFTLDEQADRLAAFFRIQGMVDHFAPVVFITGHGSASVNNPHRGAYDCGACSGRHGGPNARLFASFANRPEVRTRLVDRGVVIPADTWFLGSEHNTADEQFVLFDEDLVPAAIRPALDAALVTIREACRGSAHERCRRLASAPHDSTREAALRHVIARTADLSQPRPELGHVTNAMAVVGRRSVSRGLFLDRRSFLIGYDPDQDPEGSILEGVLLAAGPVGAGINLEYYFSTVDNDRFGCGTKLPHNASGLVGVMDGAESDLRTGLPRQMIEIHEPVRLQLFVEATPERLLDIVGRQPILQTLVGNGWIHVISIDPADNRLAWFDPEAGAFTPWDGRRSELERFTASAERYRGAEGPLPPALIRPEARP